MTSCIKRKVTPKLVPGDSARQFSQSLNWRKNLGRLGVSPRPSSDTENSEKSRAFLGLNLTTFVCSSKIL